VHDYVYDDNGNMTQGRNGNITYSAFDKPTLITSGTSESQFAYGASRSRYKRVDVKDGVTTTTYYAGSVEVVSRSDSDVITYRRNLPSAISLYRSNGTTDLSYLHKDHLGSLDTITNDEGDIKQKVYFDAWGKKAVLDTSMMDDMLVLTATPLTLSQVLDITPRGFTGHESIEHADIIHMNGRIYDPTLGRFLQADPVIQSPENSQSYNRYAYVLNNPLSYTDPSGYFFKALGKFVKKNWRTIVAIGIAAVGGYYALAALKAGAVGAAYVIAGASGFASGLVSTGSLRGALTGAFTSMAFLGIGQATMGMNGGIKALSHGLAGGIISDLQGGKFGHGFISAGLTKGAQVAGMISDKLIQGALQSAILGGTISKITGGKFANGAITAAFQFAMNKYVSDRSTQDVQSEKLAVGASSKALGKLLGSKSLELGIEIDSDGNITGSGGINLEKLKISLNSNMEATVVGGPDSLVGESFKVYDHSAQKAVASFGVVELSVAGYDNGVVNFDVQLGAGGYIKYQGGFDLRNWGPAGQYIRAVHQRETYINSYICKNLPGNQGC